MTVQSLNQQLSKKKAKLTQR